MARLTGSHMAGSVPLQRGSRCLCRQVSGSAHARLERGRSRPSPPQSTSHTPRTRSRDDCRRLLTPAAATRPSARAGALKRRQIWAWLASRQANIIMQQADPVPGAKSPR
mmetsp:Transcript_10091/g.17243  ORF Transcript_10091/g.17243 Transcript_10091/m.17243 type:complete len:110 (-) Transcript_10091:254-583(-)